MARYATGKVDEAGYPLVSGEALDYTFFNLIKGVDGDLRFIDRKWRFLRELPSDYILFRNLYHVHTFLGPFVKEKDPRKFVSSILTGIYPRYDPERIRRCCALEEEFQSAVNLDQVRISLDPRPIFSVEQTLHVLDSALTQRDDEVSRLSQELKARERQLTETVQTVGKMTEGLAILKRLIQRLIQETVSAELLGDAGELCLKLGMIDTGQSLFEKSRSLDSQKNHPKSPKFSKSGRKGSAKRQSPNHPE